MSSKFSTLLISAGVEFQRSNCQMFQFSSIMLISFWNLTQSYIYFRYKYTLVLCSQNVNLTFQTRSPPTPKNKQNTFEVWLTWKFKILEIKDLWCSNFLSQRELIWFVAENLQYLRLGDNNLHSVPSDALRRLHRLRHLDLRSNNITVLPEDTFTGYGDSITFLNLQKNLWESNIVLTIMIEISSYTWIHFIFLTDSIVFIVGSHRIKILPPMIFENLNSLETLNLQNNKLVHIPEDVTETIVDTLRMVDITGRKSFMKLIIFMAILILPLSFLNR